MAVRKKVRRASSKTESPWTDKLRGVINSIPKNSLKEIKPRHIISMLREKHPEIEISTSKRVYISILLRKARTQTKAVKKKTVRARGLWSAKEPWEIAMQMLTMCGGDHAVAQKKLRDAKSCLTKIKKIELRAASVRKVV